MTHEPIRVIHFSPHITWQGTQAELDAMLAEGWPMGSASEIIAACKRDAAEAKAYAAELEAKLAKAEEMLEREIRRVQKIQRDLPPPHNVGLVYVEAEYKLMLAELKGETAGENE
jgi:hypothetical protein